MAITLHSAPARDWLPSGLSITYTFASDSVSPKVLGVRIEVANGSGWTSAGVMQLPPDTAGRYAVNVAPYLEAMFTAGPPVLTGQDSELYKRYRLLVGESPGFTGYYGTPEYTTTPAHALLATVQTEADSGFYTLTRAPVGVNSSAFEGIETRVEIATGELTTRPIAYDTGNPYPETCYPYPIQLYWLNQAGGWQTWAFGQKHEYSREVPEPLTWQDANGTTHTASFEGIRESVNVYSGFIPAQYFNTVFGLLNSVRVYHLDNGVFWEVQIAPGEYLKHKEGQRRKELNFSLTYAEQIKVQNV